MTTAKKRLLITGYGPFKNYTINPSWEAVKKIDPIPGWEIIKQQLDVEYDKVASFKYPSDLDLIIHVGVGRDGPLRLESLANNSPYVKSDTRYLIFMILEVIYHKIMNVFLVWEKLVSELILILV